jgi:hypothetical protein
MPPTLYAIGSLTRGLIVSTRQRRKPYLDNLSVTY